MHFFHDNKVGKNYVRNHNNHHRSLHLACITPSAFAKEETQALQTIHHNILQNIGNSDCCIWSSVDSETFIAKLVLDDTPKKNQLFIIQLFITIFFVPLHPRFLKSGRVINKLFNRQLSLS